MVKHIKNHEDLQRKGLGAQTTKGLMHLSPKLRYPKSPVDCYLVLRHLQVHHFPTLNFFVHLMFCFWTYPEEIQSLLSSIMLASCLAHQASQTRQNLLFILSRYSVQQAFSDHVKHISLVKQSQGASSGVRTFTPE